MGSEDGGKDESPVHRVWIDAFWMSDAEVTIAEYLHCCEAGVCRLPDWWNRDYFNIQTDDITADEWMHLPVTGISWVDAMEYCRWKDIACRLPTEAEWEYACRAGSETVYFWGDRIDDADKYANVGDQLLPVRSKLPNSFGLYDITGNVWEWCLDIYDSEYYKVSPAKNPDGPDNDSNKHVIRGGSWNEYSWNLRSANRSFGDKEKGYKGIGFRIVYNPN